MHMPHVVVEGWASRTLQSVNLHVQCIKVYVTCRQKETAPLLFGGPTWKLNLLAIPEIALGM